MNAQIFNGNRQYPSKHITGNSLIFESSKFPFKKTNRLPHQKIEKIITKIFDLSSALIVKVQDKSVINNKGPHKSQFIIFLCFSALEERGFITCFNL